MKIPLIAISLALSALPQQNPPLESILNRVSLNVQEMQTSLPDFACDEKLVKDTRRPVPAPYDRIVTMKSVVTVTRFTRGGDTYYFLQREIQSVSGQSPLPPMINTLTDNLARAFAPQNLSSNAYSFAGRQNFRGISAFVVEFKTRPGQTALSHGGNITPGGSPEYTMKGKAWIDSNTMLVLRLEIEEDNPLVVVNGPTKVTADYGSVDISGKPYWRLTRFVQIAVHGEQTGEYSGCRKFEVTSEIRPVR
jgi:hypothetical protein